MVLGAYYMTRERLGVKGTGKYLHLLTKCKYSRITGDKYTCKQESVCEIPVLDFQRHLMRKFSNLNDAHLVVGMDTDSGTETVHIHRGKLRQLKLAL